MLENFYIPFTDLKFHTLLPMFITIFGAICILSANAFTLKFSRSLNVALCMLFIAIDLAFVLGLNGFDLGFFGTIRLDGISILTQIIILVASLFFIFLAISKERYAEFQTPEFYPLYLFMTAGFQFMVSSDNLILILLGLEIASLSLCVLIAFNDENTGIEAAIKYFVMGVLASAFYAIGAMILYLATGNIEIHNIVATIYQNNFEPTLLLITGFIFMIGAIGFKISLVPFHTWMPDVYEGSNPVLAGYISIVPKIAGFAVAIRIFDVFIKSEIPWIEDLLYILVIITITLPNIMAFMQEDIKRMLSFSSISHSGFALACIFINTTQSQNAMFIYWFMFLFTNIGAFAILWLSKNKKKLWHSHYDHPYSKFQGLVRVYPLMAILLAIFMFSLAGIPPFAVFWGKMLAVSSAINAGYIWLAIIMMLNSAIAAYYYLKLIVFMFLKEPVVTQENSEVYIENATYSIKGVIGIAAIICCLSIFMVQFLLDITSKYITNSVY
ncbi:NADH-quinone oxidoreductase subunit N [Helicobacter sp. 12S02232-10]|uniref:NADH-quinone oxidoreductase subunit NuoN n=1 Tax=Helicobacter sp. 12S02232-10 TaxID=1476197 RepID=UPI000BA6D373|nr:NADH-quinone oxidoreductase subunit NuoN [Helicobacter sp. 12S02232-10]PAF49771.1 NADH-quinone oxidoreductase subunit N [Helicobacter sp. 12S02232-10]